MERVYWIEYYSELTKMNDEIAEYGGHVTLIASASATESQDAVVHAFAVVSHPDDSNPLIPQRVDSPTRCPDSGATVHARSTVAR